jgi:hypothetical protein
MLVLLFLCDCEDLDAIFVNAENTICSKIEEVLLLLLLVSVYNQES